MNTTPVYFVITKANVTTEIFDRCKQSRPSSARGSLDGTTILLSFENNHDLPFDVVNKALAGPFTIDKVKAYLVTNSVGWERAI